MIKVAVGLLLLGIFIGHALSGEDVRYKVVPHTVTKTETVNHTEYVTDPACVKAGSLARQTVVAANKIDAQHTVLLEIMAELRIAIVQHDIQATNALEERLRHESDKTVGASETIGALSPEFEAASAECNKETS